MTIANGPNGWHDGSGRFRKGNPGGPGNPFVRRVAELRRLLLDTVTDQDLAAVVKKLLAAAKEGQPWAVKELLDRLLGKPAQAPELTGAEGEPLGLSLHELTVVILGALADHPQPRVAVAAKLKELSLGRADGAGGGP